MNLVRKSLPIASVLTVLALGASACAGPSARTAGTGRCPTEPVMLFFNFQSDEILKEAAPIVDLASEVFRTCGARKLTVSGHTDRSAGEAADPQLSQRRADNVKRYLIGRHVPASAIAARGFGSSRPLVQTPAGERKPQNRRVEIRFSPGGR